MVNMFDRWARNWMAMRQADKEQAIFNTVANLILIAIVILVIGFVGGLEQELF